MKQNELCMGEGKFVFLGDFNPAYPKPPSMGFKAKKSDDDSVCKSELNLPLSLPSYSRKRNLLFLKYVNFFVFDFVKSVIFLFLKCVNFVVFDFLKKINYVC